MNKSYSVRVLLIMLAAYAVCNAQLRVVSPNGGEFYPAAGSMEIMWEGIGPNEFVELDYSTNNGKSWESISEKVKGLKYLWEKIPLLPSHTCLVRVRQPDANPSGYKLEQTLRHEIDGIRRFLGFKWSPSGDKIITINDYNNLGHIWVWDTHTGNRIAALTMPEDRIYSIEWSPDEKYIGTVIDKDELIIWDTETGNDIKSFTYGNSGFSCAYWNSDGSRITYTDNLYGTCFRFITYNTETWNTETNITLNYKRDSIHIFCGRQKNGHNYVTYINDTVCVINTENGSVVKQLTNHYSGEHPYYWDFWQYGYGSGYGWGQFGINSNYGFLSPDNNKILLPADESTLNLMDFITGNILFSIGCKNYGFLYNNHYFANWSPDSRKVITVDTLQNNSIRMNIRDTENGKILNSIKMTNRFFPEWNPDSYRIALFGGDKSIKIINSENNKTLQNIISPDTVLFYNWSPDGKRIAASCFDSTIRIWAVTEPYLQEDVSDSIWSIVKPMAVSKDIDMGMELVGYQKDSVIQNFIVNTGIVENTIKRIYFEGQDISLFSVDNGSGQINISPGQSVPLGFHFKPESPGTKNAEIIIVTLSDTIKQSITGEGVQPEIALLNNNIDFGEVRVSKTKDSLVTILQNKSFRQVQIDSMKLAGVNPGEFEIPNNIPFYIQSGEQKEILLRFSPTSVGNQTCNLECYFNGPGSPTMTTLLGTGIFRPAEIQAGNITFETLVCNQQAGSTIQIANKGMEDLIVSNAEITGANQNDFEIVPTFTQMTVPPGETKNINIIFKPSGTGVRNADLILKSNSYIDSVLTIPLTANKDSIALVPFLNKIDLGYLCPGEYKDTSLIISNSGTVKTGGYVEPTAGLSIAYPEFTIDKENTISLLVQFAGKSDNGIFNETITITDSVCGYSRLVEVTGEIAEPAIDIEAVGFVVRKGKSEEKQIKISNTGKRDLVIKNPLVTNPPFALIGNPFPLYIPAGESREITIRFSPADTLEVIQDITFAAEPCGIDKTVAATGKGFEVRARLRAGNAEGYAGDKVEIPVYLEEPQNISLAGTNEFKADLLFNPTVLSPLDRQITMIDKNTGSVSLKNLPLNGIAGEEITRVKFTAALGNSEYSPILFSNIESDAGGIDFDTVSGCFRLLGVCRDGGDRLINSTGGEILSILPNPASEILEIEFDLQESGWTRIYLSDIIGNEVKLIYESNVTTYGKRKLSANINDMAAGVYFVILQTPTGRQAAVIIKN